MRISVYIATSLDGYIARENGDIDWLDSINSEGEDYGYNDFIESVDMLVMGRKSFEKVLTFGDWPYGEQRVVVLSASLKVIPEGLPETVSLMKGSPEEIVRQLDKEGIGHVYLDGGLTIQQFLRAGLVDEMIISTIPVLIGAGIALFGELAQDMVFDHMETKTFKSGLVQSRYRKKD